MPVSNAVPPHTHDDRYVTKHQDGIRTGATRTVFGQQRKWLIQDGYSLLLPNADIDANAEIAIEDGGELVLLGSGIPDHDHTLYTLLAGRSGGQSINGGTDANDDLTLQGTSNATKTTSYVILQPTAGNVGIGTNAPTQALDVNGVIKTRGDQLLFEGGSGLGADQGDATATLYNRAGVGPTFSGLQVVFRTGATPAERLRIDSSGNVGIGATAPGGKLEVDQLSTTAAIPTLLLKQADLSEEFIEFNGTVDTGNPIDTAALGTYYGKIRVSVNGTAKYIALYNT